MDNRNVNIKLHCCKNLFNKSLKMCVKDKNMVYDITATEWQAKRLKTQDR